jgi:acyl-CoA synthetase (AMP-forming)/AMP-acid ligase II
MRNVSEFVFNGASRAPDAPAIITAQQTINYRQLRALLINFGLHLRDRGIDRSSRVIIDSDDPIVVLCATLALAMLGCSWVLATKAAIDSDILRTTHLLHDGKKPHQSASRHIMVDQNWKQPPSATSKTGFIQFEGFLSPDSPWMVAQSSGSTGTPKFMEISAANSISRSDPTLLLDASERPVAFSFFHPLHPGNYFNIMRVLARGGTFIFDNDYEVWLRNGITYVIGAPNHFSQFFAAAPARFDNRIGLAWLGGGPIFPHFLNRMLDYFRAVANTYGSTEAGIVSWKITSQPMELRDSVSLGCVDPRAEMNVVDDRGNAVTPGTWGVIRLRSPWLVSGYIGDGTPTAQYFNNDWFYPGDIGAIAKSGEVYIAGRVTDQLNLGGSIINATDIDRIIQSVDQVSDGFCFADADASGVLKLSAIVEAVPGAESVNIAAEIRRKISAQMGAEKTPSKIYFVPKVPRNENRKVLRQSAAEVVRDLVPQ